MRHKCVSTRAAGRSLVLTLAISGPPEGRPEVNSVGLLRGSRIPHIRP